MLLSTPSSILITHPRLVRERSFATRVSNTVLCGQGQGSTIIKATGNINVLVGNADNWTVRDLSIVGDSGQGFGVYCSRNRKNIIVERVNTSNLNIGIAIHSCENVNINHCESFDNTLEGIYCSMETGYNWGENISIRWNNVHDNGRKNIAVEDSDHVLIEGNICARSAAGDYALETTAGLMTDVKVINNSSENATGQGIYIISCTNPRVSNNTVIGATGHGIGATTGIITNNEIRDCINWAIIYGLQIKDNAIYDCGRGIQTTETYAEISGNHIEGSTQSSSTAGAMWFSGTDQKWHDNTLVGNYNTTHWTMSGTRIYFYNNTVISSTYETLRLRSFFDDADFIHWGNVVIGKPSSNSGISLGTGVQQTVAHGLWYTPTWDKISIVSDNASESASVYMSAAPDATNIYVTCNATNSRWHWGTIGK